MGNVVLRSGCVGGYMLSLFLPLLSRFAPSLRVVAVQALTETRYHFTGHINFFLCQIFWDIIYWAKTLHLDINSGHIDRKSQKEPKQSKSFSF